MSSSPTLETTPVPGAEPRSRAEGFIDRQLGRAAAQVRVFDLLGHLLTWCASVLAFLLTLAIIDAWIFPFGSAARWIALLTLILGSIAYLGWKVAPPLLRRINPMYAARMLEESRPELKNGLVNVLSLREHPELVRRRILDLVAERTATDLSQISIDTAIDRTYVIRVGYVLVALVAIAGAYKIFSPKDPLTTLGRIVAPAADVPPPSRVQIIEVLPGDASIRFGEALGIEAQIEGLGRDDTALLKYTTDDGRAIDEPLSLVWDETSQRFKGSLTTDRSGIERPLSYHVTAGDALSPTYRVEIQPRPTSTVDRVGIRPPKYTQLPERTVTGGDVAGPEGTEVTIFGSVSVPVKKVTLELLAPTSKVDGKEDRQRSAARKIDAALEGREFQVRFRLEMDEARTLPKYDSYRIQLLTDDNQVDPDPTHYRIQTTPDIAPEIRWLAPRSTEVSLPVDGRLDLETDAVDRDWQISKVTLQISRDQTRLAVNELLDASRTRDDRHLGKYRLIPSEIGAKPGDVLELIATAEDDRHHPVTDRPESNTAQTPILTVRIEAPRGGRDGNRQPGGNQAGGEAGGEAGQGGESSPQGENGEPSGGGGGGESQTGQSQQGEGGQSSGSGSSGQNPENSPMPSDQQEGSPMDSGAGGSGAAGEGQEGQEGENQPQGSGANSPASQDSGEARDGASGGSESGSAEQGAAGNQSQTGGNPSDGNPDSATGNSPQDAANSGNNANPSGENSPMDSGAENAANNGANAGSPQAGEGQGADGQAGNRPPAKHEGEAFERLLERLERERNQQSSTNGNNSRGNNSPGNNAGPSRNGNTSQEPANATEPSNPANNNNAGESSADNPAGSPRNSNPSTPGQNSAAQNNPAQNNPAQNNGAQNNTAQPDPMNGSGSPNSDPTNSPQNGANQNSTNPSNGPQNSGNAPNNTSPNNQAQSGNAESPGSNPSTPSANNSGDPSGNNTGNNNSGSENTSDPSNSRDPSGNGETGASADNPSGSGSPGNEPAGDENPAGESSTNGSSPSTPAGADNSPRSPAGNNSGTNTSDPANPRTPGEGEPSGNDAAANSGTDPNNTPGSPADQSSDVEGTPNRNADQSTDGSSRPGTARPGDPSARSSQPRPDVELADGDPANLEYARQTTDLVLDYLKDQKDSPDPQLLQDLGWSEEQFRTFLDRWEAMRQAAAKGSAADRQRLDDRLRSLGLMPRASGTSRTQRTQDQLSGLSQDGARTAPPVEYAEKFRQFLRGAAQAGSSNNNPPDR